MNKTTGSNYKESCPQDIRLRFKDTHRLKMKG